MTILQQDFYRECGKKLSTLQMLKKCIHPNLRFIFIFRKCQESKGLFYFFWRILLQRYQIKYGYQIYPKTQIGAGLYLGHWGSLVINPLAKIGKNCNIAQGVTIGQQNRGKKAGYPTIGNEVWIGTNAVIVGNIHIGNNVLIAPNSYVNFDVPDNSIVIGNPAQVISDDEATKDYINNKI